MESFLHSKKQLEIVLERVPPHPIPKIQFEQYTTTSHVAAEMLFIASSRYNDIKDKSIMDLGCGTGRLAIGAALLDARDVVGVDLDPVAVNVARQSSEKMNLKEKMQWVVSDLEGVNGRFDTVLQNPPFGVRRRGADRAFILKAIQLGNVVYSLHKSVGRNREFIKSLVSKHKATITDLYQMTLTLPHTFRFHSKKEHVVPVDLYRVVTSAVEKQ
jgi:putative methylase